MLSGYVGYNTGTYTKPAFQTTQSRYAPGAAQDPNRLLELPLLSRMTWKFLAESGEMSIERYARF